MRGLCLVRRSFSFVALSFSAPLGAGAFAVWLMPNSASLSTGVRGRCIVRHFCVVLLFRFGPPDCSGVPRVVGDTFPVIL